MRQKQVRLITYILLVIIMADVKILLVQDESIDALDIKQTLEYFGYKVPYIASSGEEGVEKALEIKPDLILMDIILNGDTNSIEAVSKIKDLDIPIIYLIAHSEESIIERAKLTEPYGYIIKPYDSTELKYAIELALYKNKMKKELRDTETKYRTLFNQAADGIFLIKGNEIIECNEMALEIYGTNREQLIGKTIYSKFSPELQPNGEISENKANEYIKKALDGHPQHFEWKHLKYNGTPFYAEISLNRLKIKDQYLLQAIVRDITDRKQTEESLKDIENEYHDLFNHLNSGVAVYEAINNGKDFIVKDLNTAAENIEHIKKEDVIGKKLTVAFPGVKNFGILEVFQRVWKTGKSEYFPENIYKDEKDPGSWRENWVYKLPNGKIVAISNDISERKKAEIKRIESEEFLENIVDNIPNMIFIKNADKLDFEMVNKAAEELMGHSREEFMGKTDYDFFSKDEADFFIQKDREVLQKKKLLDIPEETINTKKLGQRILHTKKIPLLNTEGEPQYLLGISEDITELKKAEKIINESEGLLRGLFDNMPNGMSVYQVKNDGSKGSDYIIKEFNQTSQKIEGMKREDVIGRSLKDIRPEIDEYGLIPIFKKVWETGNPIHFPAKIYIDEKYANWYENYVFKAPTGEVVAIYVDVTEQEKAKEKIQNSLQEKEILLQEVHHRVKNNLQIIASLLHLQERNENDKETIDLLKETEGRVKSMAAIHEKLYESPAFNKINFKQYVEKLVYDILYSYGIKTGTIKTKLDIEDININIETAVPLGLIVNELLTNSVKYAFPQSEGTINITLHSIKEKIILIISDDGIGLPKNINIKNSETLGLQLVNNLVEQIDGIIKIYRNNGTKYKISFKELKYKERI